MAKDAPDRQASSGKLSRKIAIHVGHRITELRQDKQWTRNALATRAGIAYSNLALLEAGDHEPNLSTMLALVRTFGLCSIEELIGGPLGTRILLELERTPAAPPPDPA